MSDFRRLSPVVLASPQLGVDDVAKAAALGVTLIVNNRPEGESADQVPGSEIERAAQTLGLGYLAIPIDQSGFSLAQIEQMAGALADAKGEILAYCRSGTRSTMLWALAEASRGREPEVIAAAVEAAGYNPGAVRASLDDLAARARATGG